MDLSLTPQQQELRDGLASFLDARRPMDWGDDPRLWADLVSEGWVTVGFPEASGGRGGGVGDLVVVAETLGRVPLPTPFHGGIVLCGQALGAASGESERLRALLSGARRFTYCGWEGLDDPGVGPPAVAATASARGWRLEGTARFVPYADAVDELLVLADVQGGRALGPTLFAVPSSAPGLGMDAVQTVGGDRFSHVIFSGVEVGPSHLVGQLGGATRWLRGAVDVGRVVLAAEMVGAAAAALSHATAWATGRIQFGAPIGSLQAVQHHLADAFIDVVTAQDAVYDAAGIIDRGEDARVAAAEAKAYCGDACRRVTAAAHQACGGEGIYADEPLHRWHRRVAGLVPMLGSVGSLRAAVAASFLGDP